MATSSIRDSLKKKYSTSEKKKELDIIRQKQPGQTAPIDTSSTRGKLRAKYDAVYSEIDSDYINSFFQDAKANMDSIQARYDSMDSSNKDSIFNEQNTAYHDLSERSNKIRKYLNRNKASIDSESYRTIISQLDDIDKGFASVNYSFYEKTKWDDAKFKEYNLYRKYSGMTREELTDTILKMDENHEDFDWLTSYSHSLHEYEKWGHYYDDPNFDEYAAKGAQVSNPSWDDSKAPLYIFGWTPFGEGETVNNMVTFAEANKGEAYQLAGQATMSGAGLDEETKLVIEINDHMTNKEKALYNYLIGKGETEKANDYLEGLRDTFAYRLGENMANQVNGTWHEPLVSAFFGMASYAHGLGNLDNYVMGTAPDPVTADQYAYEIMSSDNEGFWKFTNDISYTVGNMLPSIAIGAVTSGAGGSISMGLSATGNAYAQMRNQGYDEWQSRGYATLVGASEGALSYFISGITKLGGGGKGLFQTAATKLLPKFDKALARVAIQVGANMLDEGLEEAIQDILEPAFKALMTGETFESPEWEDVFYSALLGAVSAGALEGVPTVVETSAQSIKARNIYGSDPQSLVTEALEIDPENAHAQRMQARLDNGKKLSGYQLNRIVQQNEATLISQDKASIQSAAESRLSDLGETGDVSAIAKALAKQAAGEKLTRNEKNIISESKYGQRVANELNAENIQSGDFSSEWSQKLDTNRINVEEYSRLVEAAEKPMEDVKNTDGKVVPDAPKAYIEPEVEHSSVLEVPPVTDKVAGEESLKVTEESSANDQQMTGKTFQKSTGNELQVKMFTSVGGKDTTVSSESGENISLSDVSWGNESEALVMQSIPAIDHIDTHGANTILHAYRSGENNVSAASFISGTAHVFKSGFFNSKPLDEYTAKLTPNQVDLIYNAGREAAAEHYRAEQEKADKKNKAAAEKDSTAAKKGGVFYGYDGKTIDQRNDGKHKPPTQDQRVAIDFTKRMAKRFGSTVYFYESYVDENGNRVYKAQDGTIKKARGGFYDPKDGSIHIDLNGDHVLFTVSHELVHFIKDWSPKQFKKMADLVMEGFNRQGLSVEELIANKQAEYAEDGIKLTEDQAFEEVVAASLEGIMADGRVMELMQKLEAEDKSLGAKVKKFFQDIGNMIRKAIDTYKGSLPDSAEGRLIRQMEDIYSQLQEAFAEGVYDAGESFQNAENTTSEGGVRYKVLNGVTGENGIVYEKVVQPGTVAFENLKRNRTKYMNHLHAKIFNRRIPITDFHGEDIYVEFAKSGETVKKLGAKEPHKVLGMLEHTKDNLTRIAILNVKELLQNSAPEPTSDENSHGWLDKFGWQDRKVMMLYQDVLYPVILHIANADDGRHLLYEISVLKKEEQGLTRYAKAPTAETARAPVATDEHRPAVKNPVLPAESVTQPEKVVKKISSTDSDGNQLTAVQQAYFADSVVRDADGNLQVMYRGDSEEVTVYDRKKSKPSNLYGRGFYYTNVKSHAGQYGNVRAFYLNTVDPLMPGQHRITKDQMLRFLEAIENDGEDYDLYNYGEGATAQSVLEMVWGKGDFEMLQDVSASAVGDLVAAVELFNEINGTTYDSIRLPTETVIFNSNQAKLTTNKNPTDNSDIRYSVGRKTDRAAQEMVEKENDALREDVAQLKDLLKLQGKETHGTKFTPSSVESAARYLKKNAGAKGDTKALTKLLNSFYEYIATEKELSWDGVREQAKPIAQWLMDHREHTRSDYAQEVLDAIHGSRVHLDETQLAEAVYRFESYDAFRRSMEGAITISKNAKMSLDIWWQEMAGMYPDVFNADTTASDMPGELFDIVNRLRNENSSALEYEHNRRWIEQDLIRDVYDSYWRVSNLRTVADRYAAQMNRLKSQHAQRISNMKADTQKKIEQLKEQHKAEVQVYRNAFRQSLQEQIQELSTKYQESRKKDVDSRHRTVMRQKIRKVIRDLDKILNRGDKKRNVKEDMKDFVAEALSAAEVLFTDNYTNEDIIRNGFGVELTKEESKYLEEARGIMEELSNLPTGDYDAWQARQEAEEKLKSKLAYRMAKLKDAFFRERQRLNKAEVAEVLGNLADAYAKLENSEYAYVNGAYHEAVYQYLKMLQEDVGGAKIKDMTLGQLEELHKAYTMVLTTIQNANKMFADDLKQSKEELANRVMMEVYKAGGEHGLWSKGQLARNQASWNNTKPIYAAERIGSPTFVKLFNGLLKGQYGWATDMAEAKDFRQKVADKYGFKNWDMEKTYKFTSSSGIEFELNLNQIMALYAYAKREQAHDHLLKGGFVFGKNTEVVVNEHGIKRTYLNKSARAHTISDEIMGEIVSKLSAEQKGFVDEMQDYLSTTMGNKGNEVSMKLYGVKLFMEKFYFPLRSAGQFKEKAKEADLKQQQGQIRIVNSGFTNAVTPKASNPVVLDGFTDVWAGHVNEMSLYHSMVLPMEDFRRVYHYASPNMEGQESASVNSFIENAYGDAATGYFDQLYNELNGGAIVDPRENLSKQMIGKFKKAAVMLSNSVVVQQFSAIGRAYALIDPKYFIGSKVDKKKHAALWDELKKYAPVAIIKEMGGFDTHTGLSAKDYLLAEEYGKGEKVKGFIKDKQYRGDIMGYLPAKADELTWCAIWEAVKRETRAKNPKMDVTSEEFLKKAGERFSEVIEKTQVYDSVLARSANMRSKNGLMQMLTAFMAEPTTTVNMIEDALRKGNKKTIARTFGAVAASIILNNVLASIVYAMRDDDEDETFLEKYAQAFTSGMLDDINPMTYYPVLKDIWSLFQGYDVERTDMAIYSDIADSVKKVVTLISKYDSEMDEDAASKYYKDVTDAVMGLLDAGASAFGIPWKNVRRDLKSYFNTYNTFARGDSTTWNSFVDAVGGAALDAIPIVGLVAGKSDTDKLYNAIVSGDTVYVDRLKGNYKDQNAINNAIRKGLRENDPRIREAAIAWNANDLDEYMRIAREIIAENHFVQDDVVMAIRAEASALEPDEGTSGSSKVKSLFDEEKFAEAISQGNAVMANAIKTDIIQTAMKNGKTAEEAKKSFNSSAKSKLKEQFLAGNISEKDAVNALVTYCDSEQDEAMADVQSWTFEAEHPELDGLITYTQYKRWQTDGKPNGVSLDTFTNVVEFRDDGTSDSVKSQEEVAAYINALNISTAQKDALWCCFWKRSTLKNAPWH